VPANITKRLPWKLTFWVIGLWAFIAIFSYIFVRLIFPLSAEQSTSFIITFIIGVVICCGLSIALLRLFIRPLMHFFTLSQSGKEISQEFLEKTTKVARNLHLKAGLIGMLGPFVLMVLIGLVLKIHIFYFVILGLFDALFLASILFLLTQKWLASIQESIASQRGGSLGGRVIPLKLKLVILGFALATIPTLLVGTMSFFTANRLLGNEMGRNLADKLIYVNNDVGSLIVSGLGRAEIENYLSDEAEKLGPEAYIHYGRLKGDFYRSNQAKPLPPQVFKHVLEVGAETSVGSYNDLASSMVFAYAFSSDKTWVAIAPIQDSELAQAIRTLLVLIVGITLCSMAIAAAVGYFFADNIGNLIKRMARVTGEIAKGELSLDVRVVSDDEIGTLGLSLHSMVQNLRRMIKDVGELASQIASTCNQLMVKASAISTGAEVQSQSVHETSDSVEEMNSNIQSASDNLQALAQSSQETAEASQKVGESFNLMLTETGSLQETVERTGMIVDVMGSSVSEVAGSINELSQGAERSALSMAEMDRSISEVSSSAADTAQIARKSIEIAQEGAVAVRRTIEGMDRIVRSTRDASDVIVGLGNRIEAIGSILGVIDEIADQTNLLALNAAIIAAQAGEHGRGFAVVADEIRSLAERTGSSTREIAQMIGDIQETSEKAIKVMRGGGAAVNEGVSLAKQAGDALNQILVSFEKAAENVDSIAGYTEGQARSSEEVAREIAHVADMAGRISEAVSKQTQAGDDLQVAFRETTKTTKSLGKMVNQQAHENRQAISAISEMNEATTRANQAMLDQSKVSDGILQAIEQIREIAKNHAKASLEMGGATQQLAEKSAKLKEEISEFHV